MNKKRIEKGITWNARTGKIFIVVGLFLCIFSGLSLIFIGLPMFLFGAWEVFKSKGNPLMKIFWIGLPIWFYAFVFVFANSNEANNTNISYAKRDIIVKENFVGRIKIIETECGEKVKKVRGRQQFLIPDNGVFYFSGYLQYRSFDDDIIYYKMADDSLKRIEPLWAPINGVSLECVDSTTYFHWYDEYNDTLETIQIVITNKRFGDYPDTIEQQMIEAQDILIDKFFKNCNSR